MRPISLAAALLLVPALAPAGQPSHEQLARELADLKQQVARLKKRKAPRSLKIGVVQIVRVFDELEEKIDMNAALRQLEEKRQNRLRQLVKRAKDLEEAVKLLRPDSPQHEKTIRQLEEAKREFRTQREATEDHLYNKLFDFTHSIYKKIRAEVQCCAREGGYDLVLRSRGPDVGNFDQALRPRMRYVELNRRIECRNVLFSRPAHDFTDAIIKRLNEKRLREKAEKDKQQPPAPPEKPKAKK